MDAEQEQMPSAPERPGETLRRARLQRRLTLLDVAQATRIRVRYLQALEEDDPAALPDGVYSRGFLRNYAIFLGIPPEDVLPGLRPRRRWERGRGLRSVASPLGFGARRNSRSLVVAGALGLLVVTLAWLGFSAPADPPAPSDGQEPEAAASTTSLAPLPPFVLATMPSALGVTAPAPAASPSNAVARQVEVELRATEASWVRATVDGRIVLEEIVPAGQARRWTGQQSILLRVGNAGGVDVTANGQGVGPLGARGQPADREFTR